jgi:hypothetical protein
MITTDHPSYSPDLAPCDFFCTLKWKWLCGVNILGMQRTSNVKQQGFWRTQLRRTCNTVLYNGKSIGPSAFTQGESTLRVIMCPFRNNWN